jgi:hypothetical protein
MPTRIAAPAAALLASLWLAPSALSSVAEENPPAPGGLTDSQPGVAQGDSDQRYEARRKLASDDAYHPPRPDDYNAPSSDADRQRPPPDDAYHPPRPQSSYGGSAPPSGASRDDVYHPPQGSPAPYGGAPRATRDDPYHPPGSYPPYGGTAPAYGSPPRQAYDTPYGDPGRPPPYPSPQGYGAQYTPSPSPAYGRPYTPPGEAYDAPPEPGPRYGADAPPPGSYSSNEILEAGHTFFGSISKGLAGVIEYAFQKQGRPNGYILGQDAGGAFVAGVRFGEGVLYTRDAGTRRVYWQGPSIGWDAGAEGSKVMVLVYNLTDPEEIYQRFAGVDGSAYLVGGAGVTFQKSGDVIVAPIRAGVGLRLGANIGYLKYTRQPTWNPF